MNALPLFDSIKPSRRRREPAKPRTIEDRFADFDRQHPEVYALFVRFAEDERAKGRTRIGAKAIVEAIRWETKVNPTKYGGFKLNNTFTAVMARKLLAERPEFAGLIETRGRKSCG